jgi:hypothetical protein
LHASKIGGQNLEIKFNELGPQRFESSPGTWSNFIAGGFDCKASFCARILRTQQVWLASTPKPSTYLETDPNTNACMHLHASLKLFTHSYIIKKPCASIPTQLMPRHFSSFSIKAFLLASNSAFSCLPKIGRPGQGWWLLCVRVPCF